ncbi:MAG: hypothetical protein ABGZ36_08375 [Actinomycetota bacterium]
MEQRRHNTRTVVLVMLAALAVVFVLVLRTSSAAFTATTDNDGNSFVAGDVVLSDDDATTQSLFTETAFAPGATVRECIEVTYDGTIPDPAAVRLYSGGFTDVPGPAPTSTGLSDHLVLTVEEGTGATFGDCSTFVAGSTIVSGVTLAAFDTARTDYATGAGVWDPSATGEAISYRFSVTLDATTTPNEEQGAGTSDIAFVWEVTS